jgi:hypothetical protein
VRKINLAIAAIAVFLRPADTLARESTKTVPAGRTSLITTYRAWAPGQCGSVHGVVTVLAKPQHGRLSHHLTPAKIPPVNRWGRSTGQCSGAPTTGFAILYTPAPGFHGTDSFSLDVDWPMIGQRETDTITVNVE